VVLLARSDNVKEIELLALRHEVAIPRTSQAPIVFAGGSCVPRYAQVDCFPGLAGAPSV
jgi:hypothetical protein